MSSVEILPGPFAWIDIPAGRVTLEANMGTHDVPAFAIAKYPITNAQFAKFIEAGGYDNQTWWTEFGWEQRQSNSWTEPRRWGDSKYNGAEQPMSGASWYDAVAFCLWLSDTSGEQIMLPTEQQWQRAAQGDKGYTYPWGNDWDCQLCNNSVSPCESSQTTPVTQYEGKGDSPYGVVDMSGNAPEWCVTAYEDGNQSLDGNNGTLRVLRGGSYGSDDSVEFRTVNRDWFIPDDGYGGTGFRIARSG